MNDENGIVPPPAKTINETISFYELYYKYKSSLSAGFSDLFLHFSLYFSLCILLIHFRHNALISLTLIMFLSGIIGRTILIFHHCGHNSYTPSKCINYVLSNITGAIVFLPHCWHYRHLTHHMTLGNIDNDFGFNQNELIFHTFNQYKGFSNHKKCIYKILLHPLLFFTIITWVKLMVVERIYAVKFFFKRYYVQPPYVTIIFDQLINNMLISALLLIMYKNNILYHYLLSTALAQSYISFIFFNEHTYNPSYVEKNNKWKIQTASIHSSSIIVLPSYLYYFLDGEAYHHIHHSNAKIPFYNLKKYHEEVVSKSDVYNNVIKLTLVDCYNNMWLKLYDEDNKRYITFVEADEEIRKEKNI
jgi:omega-6 fatty acid desaturase (delta-12 desaturase)